MKLTSKMLALSLISCFAIDAGIYDVKASDLSHMKAKIEDNFGFMDNLNSFLDEAAKVNRFIFSKYGYDITEKTDNIVKKYIIPSVRESVFLDGHVLISTDDVFVYVDKVLMFCAALMEIYNTVEYPIENISTSQKYAKEVLCVNLEEYKSVNPPYMDIVMRHKIQFIEAFRDIETTVMSKSRYS